ncbi:ABC transporter substrate-binding protein [Massilia sp. H-1]|nr:ABC transporter substrate-binding protein [Massilia sp. H-1]
MWLRGGQLQAPVRQGLYQLTIASNDGYVGTCPVTVAYRNGYFEQEGVTARIQSHKTGKSALDAALTGKADLATTADIPIMLAAMQDVPVSVLATFFKTEHDHGIVARRDRGIAALADLKGKTIGVTRGTSGHFALDGFLNRQHMARTDVTIVDLKPEQFMRRVQAWRGRCHRHLGTVSRRIAPSPGPAMAPCSTARTFTRFRTAWRAAAPTLLPTRS